MRVILLLIIAILAYSKTMLAKYSARFGIFKEVAIIKAKYEVNQTHYKISTYTTTTGFIKSIANVEQYYTSEGIVKNGILIPKKFIKLIIRHNHKKKYLAIYEFDYKNKKITKITYYNDKFAYKKNMPYFAKNDVLTLYFNLPKLLKNNHQTFKALGGEEHTGRVDVDILKKGKIIKIKANLYNKVFAGDKGILFLDINSSNWVTLKGKVLNVLKIGTLKGELKSFKLIP